VTVVVVWPVVVCSVVVCGVVVVVVPVVVDPVVVVVVLVVVVPVVVQTSLTVTVTSQGMVPWPPARAWPASRKAAAIPAAAANVDPRIMAIRRTAEER